MLRPTTVSILVLALSLSVNLQADEADLSPQVRTMIEWLPADSEMLLVAKDPFEFTSLEDSYDEATIDKLDAEERASLFRDQMRKLVVGSVFVLEIDEFDRQLRGEKVQLAVAGSRRFSHAGGLGLWPYEGCQIIEFSKSSEGALEKAFAACRAHATEMIEINGHPVAVFERHFESDDWTIYVCRPRRGLLMCATNQPYLAEVLSRVDKPAKTRAFPKELAEWGHIDVKAPIWGLRHYRMDRAKEDPSVPFSSIPNDPTTDPGVIGLTCWFDGAANSAKIRYLSNAKDPVKIVTAGWNVPSEGLVPKIEQLEPGVVEITCEFPTAEAVLSSIFVLMGYVGHGVNL